MRLLRTASLPFISLTGTAGPCSLRKLVKQGQLKLLNAKVLIVGAGGLGSPAALYLAATGVGTIGIVDFDHVDLSNLNRQVIHGTDDVGRFKVDSAKAAIERLNPDVNVITFTDRLTPQNALDIIGGFDIVMDATDNLGTKFLLNDACWFAGKPYVFGGAVGFSGQAGVFWPKERGPCLRCLFPKPPPRSAGADVKRSRCPGCCTRTDWPGPGHGGNKIDTRNRNTDDRKILRL